jgi:hypothetical protein
LKKDGGRISVDAMLVANNAYLVAVWQVLVEERWW